MKEKCRKYESLFIFRSEEELAQHVSECDECAQEDLRMKKISSLIGEVKGYYQNKRRNFARLKAACIIFVFLFCGAAFGVISMNTDVSDTIKYGTTLSAEDLGFPVDSYGLIMVE